MKSKRFKSLIIASSALALLTSCGDARLFQSWTQESGAFLDEGNFGNPTMNNTQIHSGERNVLVALGERFANEVPNTVNFAFNSAVVDESAKAALLRQANWIRQFPEVRFRVYGHTDLVGSNAYNKRLGMRRARAVIAYLGTQGISRSRLEAVVSFGETKPVIATQNRERRNRRTVTEVTGFVKGRPMLLNGKYADIIFREYVASAAKERYLFDGSGQTTE